MVGCLLGDEGDIDWFIIFGVHPNLTLYVADFAGVNFMSEMSFPDSNQIELLLYQFLMNFLVFLVPSMQLFNLLHLDPFIQGIDHLLFLLVYSTEGSLLVF